MKQIVKIQQPDSLVEHMAQAHAYYSNLPTPAKSELRTNLASEQGYICCYCMKRLAEATEEHIKIEHFKDQDHYPDLQLRYSNLFGACLGNEGLPSHLQTCDTRKGNRDLIINPTSTAPNCNELFKYNAEGEISSINDNEDVNRAINEVLNLNMQTLKEGRSEVYLEVQEKVRADSRRLKTGPLKLNYLEKERDFWLSRSKGQFKPFCMVAVYYLNKKIRQVG
jgi:uncharacterized protein (TIGR02646 family)